MTELSEKKCIPCEGNTPPFDYSEIHKFLKKVVRKTQKKRTSFQNPRTFYIFINIFQVIV